MKSIVFFASGSGSNVENIVQTLGESVHYQSIFVNNPNAYVVERGRKLQIPTRFFKKEEFRQEVVNELIEMDPDLIVLAGFLWLIPKDLVQAFPNKIINIHPALLPKYGGKGMYGMNVHRAVKDAGESETGITIHYVNENYDEGAFIRQEKVSLLPSDQPEDIAEKVHRLEYEFFPEVIKELL